jgi:hypothetical protein
MWSFLEGGGLGGGTGVVELQDGLVVAALRFVVLFLEKEAPVLELGHPHAACGRRVSFIRAPRKQRKRPAGRGEKKVPSVFYI